jgi:hypothetical protein
MLSSAMYDLVVHKHLGTHSITHLRIELSFNHTRDDSEEAFFFHKSSHRIRELPRLQECDILVNDGLFAWTISPEDIDWGANFIRTVYAKTGGWIDEDLAGVYADWVYTNGGETREYQRIVEGWDEKDEEDVKGREEAMMKMKSGLPWVDLG